MLDVEHFGEPLKSILERIGTSAGAWLPVHVDGALYGVLTVTSRADPFEEAQMPRLGVIVSVGELALANAVAHHQLDRANVEYRALAATDPLTGLANRRTWDSALAHAIESADADERDLFVAIFDIDHFKTFNDTRGHADGDRLLKTTAERWRRVLREKDVLARIGGEEFALLLTDERHDIATTVTERLRSSLPAGQTCSAGIARHRPGETALDIMARADAALYEAKRQGRNRTVHAEA